MSSFSHQDDMLSKNLPFASPKPFSVLKMEFENGSLAYLIGPVRLVAISKVDTKQSPKRREKQELAHFYIPFGERFD